MLIFALGYLIQFVHQDQVRLVNINLFLGLVVRLGPVPLVVESLDSFDVLLVDHSLPRKHRVDVVSADQCSFYRPGLAGRSVARGQQFQSRFIVV